MMDRNTLEAAILALASDQKLLERFKSGPAAVSAELGLTPEWGDIISRGDRDRIRAAGVNDGISILVSRWFADDLADSASSGAFHVDTTSPLPDVNLPENLVFAGGCSHVPDLLVRPEIDPAEGISRLIDGYTRLGKDLAAADPDILLVTADAHFQGFRTGATVVGTGAGHGGSLAFFKRPDIDLRLVGAPDYARDLIRAVQAEGLECEDSNDIALDHGLIVPLKQILPRPDLPVVPIITQPARGYSPYTARAFGEVLRGVIDSRREKVAILATGGLSHWLDPGKWGAVDTEFDTYLLNMLEAGRGYDLGNLEPYPLLEHGQYEFMNWLIMLGIVGPGVRSQTYAYEPMQNSGGGWCVVNLPLAS